MALYLHSVRRSRNPLMQALSLILGLALLGMLLVFGLAIAGVLLAGTAVLLIWRWWAGRHRVAAPAAPRQGQTQVLEGEFKVIHPERNGAH